MLASTHLTGNRKGWSLSAANRESKKKHRPTIVSTCIIRQRSELTQPTQSSSKLRVHTERDDFIETHSHSSKVHQGGIRRLWQGVQEGQLVGQSHLFQGCQEMNAAQLRLRFEDDNR